jgi:hypothetical protein
MLRERWGRMALCCVAFASILPGAGCGGGNSPGGEAGTGITPPESSQGSNMQVAEYTVGEIFEVNGLTWAVMNVEQLVEVKSMFSDTPPHQPTNGAWLVVTLDFRGQEGMTGGFDTTALKVRDVNGMLYDVAEPSGAADDYRLTHEGVKNLSMAMLNDAQIQRVFAIYDVPEAGTPFTLEWMGVKDGALVTLAKVSLGE